MTAPTQITVSLLICTSGRPTLLERCLAALESGTEKPNQVVIVNGEDGRTPEVVRRHAGSFDEVVLIEHPNRNLATLRNLGLPHIEGNVVTLTDDDAVPDAQWIEAIRGAHEEHPAAGGIGGPVRGIRGTFLDRIADRVVFPDPRPGRPIHTLPTVNMSYKREVMDDVGEFDERLFRGEDVDYNWRVLQNGRPILFEPAMRVRHGNRQTLHGLYHQQYMYGRAYVRVRTKWSDMYSVYPHSLGTLRSWAKLVHAALSIIYQPFSLARTMPPWRERLLAYPVLVVHHLVWKLGMLCEASILRAAGETLPPGKEVPRMTRWHKGVLLENEEAHPRSGLPA